MRKFNMLIPALLGAVFFVFSGNVQAATSTDTYKDAKAEKELTSARYALSNLNLKSTLDFTTLPASENWDADPAPLGWTYFTNSAEGEVVVQSSTYNSADYAVDFSNASDETSDFILVSPGTTLDPAGTRVKFFAKANSMFPNPQGVKVGIMTDPTDPATYLNLANHSLTSDWAEYFVDMSSVPPQAGTYYIAIQANFDGTNKHIFVDDFVWEETPTGPVFLADPTEADFGTVMINTTTTETFFTLTNYGIGTLNVTDISLTGVDAGDFIINTVSETLPFDLDANSANSITVSVQFSPTTAGMKSASLDVTANTEVNSIPLSGECFDPTIYSLPWSENLDGVTTPEFPMGWSVIANAANTYAYYETNTGGYSPENCIQGYNSSDGIPEFYAITPPTSIDISTSRIRFQAKGDGSFVFGTMTDPADAATFSEITTFALTSNWEEHIYDLDGETSTGTYYLAFKAEFAGTYDNVYLDDIMWMEIPTTPVAEINPASYDFGEIAQNASLNSGMAFTLRNGGVGDLTVTSVSGLDGTEFAITDIDLDTVSIPALESRTFGITYHPIDGGADAVTLSIETNGGTATTDLTGSAYVLPDGMVEIGWEEIFNTHLPMEPYYGYSYSQSLYLQSEINVSGSKITSVFYRKNDSDVWADAGQINLYIGHTSQTEISDWIPLSELTEVHYEEALPAGDADGWVEFILTEPFIYNNVDNLVVAFDENKPSYDSGDDEFYNHATANNMSIYYYSDGTNPDPASPPSGTLMMNRPNIRFQFEEMPATPTPVTEPEAWYAGMRPVGFSTTSETFTITNNGTDPLTVSAITDLSSTPFSTTFVPGDVNLELGLSYEFSFTFAPTATGVFEETFIIETNGVNDTVMLYGSCDYALPSDVIEIGWDTATIAPNLPMEPSSVFSYSQSLYKQSEIDVTGEAVYKVFYRQKTTTTQDDPVKVYMAHYSGDNLESGWEALGNLVQVYDGTFGTQNAEGWVEITLDQPFVYNNTDNLLVAFLDNGDNAYMPEDGFYQSVTTENLSRLATDEFSAIDPAAVSGGQLLMQRPNIRFVFGAPPTDPIFNLNLTSWDAGMTPGNQTSGSGDVFKISNTGGGTLTLVDAVLLNGTEFGTSLVAGDVSLNAGEEYFFNFTYSPVDIGTDNDTLVITHADGTDTVFLTGYADYVLPEGMVEIGQGTVTDAHLPMEPYYGYSYSQSLYLQNEIMMDGMRISKVYYQKNNQNDWPDAGQINIYIGHTSLTEITDWVDVSTLQPVTYSEALPVADADGWVEFVLNTPFIYNNTDNLIIAFDENKPSYDSGSDEFYNHSVDNNMSIYYYNDSNNPDPTAPPSGTLKMNRPNIRLQFEDLPTSPVFAINPESADYGTVIVSSLANQSFTVQNNGIDILTTTDIYLGGDNPGEFVINNLPTFPVDQTNDFADAFTFDVDFAPTADGNMSAKLYIDHSEGLDSVMLTGVGYDATIYAIPYSEYFDDPATTTVPEITLGWNTILNSSNSYSVIETEAASYMSEPNSVEFYNSGDLGGDYFLVSPPTSLDPAGTRVRFYANGSSSHQIQVGYLTAQDDASTFVPVDTVDLTGSYTQFTADMSAAAPVGTWYIGFKVLINSTYNYINIDNVIWEEIPTTPVFEVNPTAIDFGAVAMMGSAGPNTVTVTNSGVGDLIITDVSIVGADAAEFSVNVIDDLNDTITNVIGDNLTVEASFNPTTAGVKVADIQFTDVDMNTYTVALTGNGVDVTMYPDTLVTFDDGAVPPPFWTEAEGLLNDTVVFTSTGTGAWTSDDYANNTDSTQSARLNIWSTGADDWMISTPIYLGDGTSPVIFEFDLATTPYSGTGDAGSAPDDKFAVLIQPEGETEWLLANALRLYDNEGSAYVYDDIPSGAGEHVEISLGEYTGYVKIALYGESTVGNADNNLYVDNFELRIMTQEEIALNETVLGTSILATPEFINFQEGVNEERVLDYAVDFPTPMNANLDALLLHDYMLELGTVLPTGVTVDVEIDGTNIGQIVSDGIQTTYWLSDVASAVRPALSAMLDETVTLKVNGLVEVGSYEFMISSYTALDGEFDAAPTRTLLADESALLNVTPTPATLPIEEDFSAGLPTNWTIANNGTDGADWTFVNDGLFSSTTGDNGYMQIDDFAAGATGLTDADLMTTPIDMSAATGTIMLEFEHHYDHFTTDVATVFISVDNGMTWEIIEEFDNLDQGAMDAPAFESYDITAVASGQNNVIIRWNFNDGGAQTFDWNIDDVHIYEFTPSAEAEILTFDITGQVSSSIDAGNAHVDVVMPFGTDLNGLIPTFTLSDGANAAIGVTPQESGVTAVDFTGSVTTPVVYTVTAEDGTTTKDWEVTVSTNDEINANDLVNFAVYPNPSNGQFDLNVYSENGFSYSIFAADGKVIAEAVVDAKGEYVETINLKDIAPGVYTLKVSAEDITKVKKLIIQ